jgi:hypothetical protein
MELSSKQAIELGNALIDASQKLNDTGINQEVLQMDTGEMFSGECCRTNDYGSGFTKICEVVD